MAAIIGHQFATAGLHFLDVFAQLFEGILRFDAIFLGEQLDDFVDLGRGHHIADNRFVRQTIQFLIGHFLNEKLEYLLVICGQNGTILNELE